MPGAIEGRPAGFSYVYAVNASIEDVETYYSEEMIAMSWQLVKREASETSAFGGPSVILQFARGEEIALIMLIFSTNDNYTIVSLTHADS